MLSIRLILIPLLLVVFAVFPPGAPEAAAVDSAGNRQVLKSASELDYPPFALYEKWFAPILPGPEIPTAEIIKKILGIVVPVLLLFTVFGLWYLKRLVAERTGFLEREILQRKEMETELGEANARYMKAQQLGKVGNWEYTIKTKALWGSAEAARIFGFPVDGIFSVEALRECIPDQKTVEQALRNLFENDRAVSLELDIKTCNTRERRTILFLAEPERDDSGRPGKIRGVIQDITERKKAENSLQKSERLLMEMGRIARIGGWEHDLLNNRATWTKEIFKMVEIESGIAPGPDEHLNYYPPEDRAVLEKAYRRAVETGEPFDLELQCYSANNRLFWARAVGRPEFKCGRCIKMLGTFQDITLQKEMEQRLQQAQKLEALGVLSGGIAHDFNNILTAILGFTELIRDAHPADRQLQEDLGEIDTAGRRAKELVQQILTFSRKQNKTSSPLQIQPLVKEALKLIRSTLPASIEIQADIAEEMGMVMANPTQVHQIVMNICTNAGSAMDRGGILRVKVFESTPSAQFFQQHPFLSPGRYIELQFADTGRGIAPEIMGYIFDPYFTTKNLGDGTGLGLAVTYGIVKEMAGEILVASEQGTGSVFTIFLPVAEINIPAEVRCDVADDLMQLEGNERILLVDDEPQLLKLTSRMLKQYGYAVTTARNGLAALARFKQNPLDFDMVISDIGMPGLTGDKLAGRIMSIRPTMPILLVSGYSRNVSEETVVRDGVKGLLQKPISGEQLVRKVRHVLDKV